MIATGSVRLFLLATFSFQVAVQPFSPTCISCSRSHLGRPTIATSNSASTFRAFTPDRQESEAEPTAVAAALLLGSQSISLEEERSLLGALESAGYSNVSSQREQSSIHQRETYCYELSRATGMLKLVSSPAAPEGMKSSEMSNNKSGVSFEAPRWIPAVRGEENVLVANGWSFLDPDESEPISAFDIDAADAEGLYRPKWGNDSCASDDTSNTAGSMDLSSLGFDISPMIKDDILAAAESLSQENEYSRGVLLDGKTDPPNTKMTCNGYDFRGSAGQVDIQSGIFVTAIGGLPLFASTDFAPTTGSSGWLTFSRPLATSHALHIDPEKDAMDRRVEVVCARSKCHLGHYFGPGEGYCINASALRFIPAERYDDVSYTLPIASRPTSWRPLDSHHDLTPSHRLLKTVLEKQCKFEEVALGCGCFWHVEHALRRLPGVYTTQACYAGGHKDAPTYQDVCGGNTEHAEVVLVTYDPDVCPSDVLLDCFLSMHDPTMVRAHGKRSKNTGQYRSCIFFTNVEIEQVARGCMERCEHQLGKELRTDIGLMEQTTGNSGHGWCWRAEDRHQRHDEIVKSKVNGGENNSLSTLTARKWLKEYGRRNKSIIGSAESLLHPDDDGMAMMMI